MNLPLLQYSWPARSATAHEILRWGIEEFGDRLAICTSFQVSGSVMIDMASRIAGADVRVFSIDTGRLHEETYALIAEYRRRYGITVQLVAPDADELCSMLATHGPNLFYDDPAKRKLCCEIRKVRPLKRRLATLDAWVTGLRRDQGGGRGETEKLAVDEEHGGILKLSPLADWTLEQVTEYAHAHDVPIHPLYAEGFTSIGCAPCTRAATPGESGRSSRWWWEEGVDKECGMHVAPSGKIRREYEVLLDEVLPARRPYLVKK